MVSWFVSLAFSVGEPLLPQNVVDCFEAARIGQLHVALKLLDDGVHVNSKNNLGNSLLHVAAENGHFELVKLFIARGATIDIGGFFEQSPLWEAALEGHWDIAEFLMEKGAKINWPCHNGGTILHYASEYTYGPKRNDELARWLIGNGANVNARDVVGDTPLHKAAWKGHLAVVKVLLAHDASVTTNRNGLTPLGCAKDQNQQAIISLLEQHDGRK